MTLPKYTPENWHWLVRSENRYWSSEAKAYSDDVPEVFTTIANAAELREVLANVGLADKAPGYVPPSVTIAQARVAIRRAGLFGAVDAACKAAGGEVLDAWEYSNTVSRDSALVASMSASLALTSAQVDALFTQAAAITF